MTQVIPFPKEFEHHFFRDMDKDFFLTWIVTFVVLIGFFQYMSVREFKQWTAEDIQRYTEVLYRIKATPPKKAEKVVEPTSEATVSTEEVIEEVEKKDEIVETTQVSEARKAEIRDEKKAARRERQELRKEKVAAAAQRMKILAGPTTRSSSRAGGTAAAREALGLSSGDVEGFDVKKMVGMVDDAGKAKKIKKVRGTGVLSEEAGEIDIEELRNIDVEDLDMMFKESSVELNRQAITAKGRGAMAKERSQSVISDYIQMNAKQVQYCYWVHKRRDSSLKGRVVIEFTIEPSGEVSRVRFRTREWGGNSLGADVERCINSLISSWKFEPIDKKAGNATFGATFGFTG